MRLRCRRCVISRGRGPTRCAGEGGARLHAPLGRTTAGELCKLDQLIGQASAELATELLPADLVVSHGQTVHHWVQDGEAKGTLQFGQPAWIVEATGLPVI